MKAACVLALRSVLAVGLRPGLRGWQHCLCQSPPSWEGGKEGGGRPCWWALDSICGRSSSFFIQSRFVEKKVASHRRFFCCCCRSDLPFSQVHCSSRYYSSMLRGSTTGALLILVLVGSTEGYPGYKSSIPNGNSVVSHFFFFPT